MKKYVKLLLTLQHKHGIYLLPFQTTFNSLPAVVLYTFVIQSTEQRQYQTRSSHTLHCQIAACGCAVSGSVTDSVM